MALRQRQGRAADLQPLHSRDHAARGDGARGSEQRAPEGDGQRAAGALAHARERRPPRGEVQRARERLQRPRAVREGVIPRRDRLPQPAAAGPAEGGGERHDLDGSERVVAAVRARRQR